MRPLFIALAVLILPHTANAACRQALALGLDVSGSVDQREYRLQLDGLANALTSAEVRAALLQGPEAAVRLMVYEWSGPRHIRPLMGWTDILSEDVLNTVAASLRATSRVPANPSTALGEAMAYGIAELDAQSDCWKQTLDISGDGKANTGRRPQDIPDAGESITINALVISDAMIGSNEPLMELTAYFRAYVLHGVDAFVINANGFNDYENAMREKLLRELQSLAIGQL